MPRDMFGDVTNPTVKVGSQAWYTVPVSILAHVVMFACVIIIPLMAADAADPTDDDGVRRGPAPAATTAAPAPGPGRTGEAGPGAEPECGAD